MLTGFPKTSLRPAQLFPCGLQTRISYSRDSYFQDDSYKNVYRDPYRTRPRPSQQGFQFKNQRQIGITLLATGFMMTTLGMMLFFEKNLLRFGNILFLSGLSLFIGPERVLSFFMQPHRLRASIIVLLGSFLVFSGRPRWGILCQFFGLLNLFGNMFPLLLAMGRPIPIVGDIIRMFDAADGSNRGRKAYSPPPQYYDYNNNSPKYYPEF